MSRWQFLLTVPEVHRTCRACGCRYKPNSKWEWIGDFIGGAIWAGFILLGLMGLLPWLAVGLLTIALFAVGFWLFPYFTPFDLVSSPETHTTTFTKLNEGWNAEPNGHKPHISIEGSDLVFEFLLNDLRYPEYKKAEKGILRFRDCWRYRLGQTNDEGWRRGQCRFSRLAPKWGEFYEVHGDLLLDAAPNPKAFYVRGIQLAPFSLDWVTVGKQGDSSRHFLFYLRDQTFECDASTWEFSVKWHA